MKRLWEGIVGLLVLAFVFFLGILVSNIVMPFFTERSEHQTNGGIVFMVVLWIAIGSIYILSKKRKKPKNHR